ncbi:MAG: hypothetical protein J7J52_04660 [Deltaproteobacteria bacterium]|nr:hypothetical protein [Deltaproteobacteria bacterium]
MSEINELSRIIGQLESGMKMLVQKQHAFCARLDRIEEMLQQQSKRDSQASFYGGVIGGFVAVISFLITKLISFFIR